MTRSAVCSGYIVLDIVHSDSGIRRAAGGTAANVAAILSFFRWNVSVVGRIGLDEAGRIAKADLEEAGVDTDHLDLDPAVSTPIIIHTTSRGKPRYHRGCRECRKGSARYVPLPESSVDRVIDCGLGSVFVFDRASSSNLLLAKAHVDAQAFVLYEPSTISAQSRHFQASTMASMVKYSGQQRKKVEANLASSPPDQIRVITYGADGADLTIGPGAVQHVDAWAVNAVDAGGAGDWTTAALLDCIDINAPQQSVHKGLELAQSIAALSTTLLGARTLTLTGAPESLWREAARLRAGALPALTAAASPDAIPSAHCAGCGFR